MIFFNEEITQPTHISYFTFNNDLTNVLRVISIRLMIFSLREYVTRILITN